LPGNANKSKIRKWGGKKKTKKQNGNAKKGQIREKGALCGQIFVRRRGFQNEQGGDG